MLTSRKKKIIIVQQKNLPKHLPRLPFVQMSPWCSYRQRRNALDVLGTGRGRESDLSMKVRRKFPQETIAECLEISKTHFGPPGLGEE